MVEFSVIILSYHPDFAQLTGTIDSVLCQQEVACEILICDDGSEENHFSRLEAYFKERQFSDYRLLGSEKNQGTVRNILKGLSEASGKYAKLIGAGDLLYERRTLADVKEFMEKNRAECCFGLMRGYRRRGDGLEFPAHTSPRDIEAYRRQDTEKIAHNLMLCEDWVSGAGIFAETDYYRRYISMLEGKVLYCEDWASALSAVDHVFLKLYDRYVVWYEMGSGISTGQSSGFREKLFADNQRFWPVFDAYCQKRRRAEYGKYISGRKRKKRLEHIKSEAVKLLYKALVNPGMVLYEMEVRKQAKSGAFQPKEARPGLLEEEAFAKRMFGAEIAAPETGWKQEADPKRTTGRKQEADPKRTTGRKQETGQKGEDNAGC